MSRKTAGIAELGRLLSRAMVAVAIMAMPLAAVDAVRAGDENVIEGTYKASSGAGLVLVVSLQRAR